MKRVVRQSHQKRRVGFVLQIRIPSATDMRHENIVSHIVSLNLGPTSEMYKITIFLGQDFHPPLAKHRGIFFLVLWVAAARCQFSKVSALYSSTWRVDLSARTGKILRAMTGGVPARHGKSMGNLWEIHGKSMGNMNQNL